MKDRMSKCSVCGSNLCYVQEINENITIHFCMKCGFQTTKPLMKKGETFFIEQMLILPDLYKELMGEDEEGYVWAPCFVDNDTGMIFANGKNASEWKWAVVKKIDISDDEKHKYPIPGEKDKYYSRRTDMGTLKEFDSDDFIGALTELGLGHDN